MTKRKRIVAAFVGFFAVTTLACDKLTSPTSPTSPSGSGNNPVTISVTPSSVKIGEASTVSWFTRASSCFASGDWNGSKGSTGSEVVGPFAQDGNKTYTLTCEGVTSTAALLVGKGADEASTKTSSDGLVTITIIQRIPAVGPLVPGQPQFIKLHVVNRADEPVYLDFVTFGGGPTISAHTEKDTTEGPSSGSLSGFFPVIHVEGGYVNAHPKTDWTMDLPGWPQT